MGILDFKQQINPKIDQDLEADRSDTHLIYAAYKYKGLSSPLMLDNTPMSPSIKM